MSNFLLIDCIALVKVWIMGLFVFHLTGVINILPVISVFAFFLRFLYNRSFAQNKY
jgi:hypothetical protein